MISAMVVDDEPLARRRLKRLLSEHADVQVVAEAGDGDGAIAGVLQHRPAVLFLDIQMPRRTGLEVLRSLRASVPEGMRPMVVFTTAHDAHAVEAFALEGTDYLLKPIEKARLAETLRRVRKVHWSSMSPPASAESTLTGMRGSREVPINLSDLAAVVVEDTIAFAWVPDGRLRLKGTLQELDQRLPSDRFSRVSRSALVQLDWIAHLRPAESGTWVLTLREPVGTEIPVSRRRARALRDRLDL